MGNGWRCVADVEGTGTLLDGTVRHGHPLVLTQVLSPGFDDEGLDVAPWISRVAKHAPAEGAVTPANRS